MQQTEPEHGEILTLLRENQRLLIENNQYLHKLYRHAVWSFWTKVVWFAILFGLPFVLYYYIIKPYFSFFGSSLPTFEAGLQEIPGWKQLYEAGTSGIVE